jgi:hypothetical protein
VTPRLGTGISKSFFYGVPARQATQTSSWPVRQLYARVGYFAQSWTKNLATGFRHIVKLIPNPKNKYTVYVYCFSLGAFATSRKAPMECIFFFYSDSHLTEFI